MWRYYCHRNGVYKPRGCGKRQLKSQGSCKSTISCPAMIIVVEKANKFYVTYFTTHYGHDKLLGHLHLADTDKEQIAGNGICL